VTAVLALPALAIGPADALALRLLAWRPELALSEPWRWWSAAWVHLSLGHWAADLAGALLVGALGGLAALPPRAAWAWALAWPLTHLTLGLQPELQRYAGLSGVLYAGVAVLAVGLLSGPQRPRLQRVLALLLLAGLLLRLGADRSWDRVVYRPQGWAFSIAPLAHAAGVAWGAVLAGLAEWLHRRHRRGA
jgi:rhomboid family GlyGly-CTERM serine protease